MTAAAATLTRRKKAPASRRPAALAGAASSRRHQVEVVAEADDNPGVGEIALIGDPGVVGASTLEVVERVGGIDAPPPEGA